jgi:hypothetical protein
MKRSSVIMFSVALLGCAGHARAITVEELGTSTGEIVAINCGSGNVLVDAGLLDLNVGGTAINGFCIDPFHFSDGSMTGYQVVGLTSAPKQNLMDANTALLLERLWGSYFSPTISARNAAGLQIAIWQLVGRSNFHLSSANDYGASGFLNAVENPNYDGPVADLLALTGPGQDYGVDRASVSQFTQSVPDASSTLALLLLAGCGLLCVPRREFRLAPVRK